MKLSGVSDLGWLFLADVVVRSFTGCRISEPAGSVGVGGDDGDFHVGF